MNKLLIISILLCLSCARQFRDTDEIVLSVLSKNVVGKTFRFNLSDKKDYLNEVDVAYLGEIETKAKEKYYIVTWGRVWGPNKHTSGSILLYDNKKQYFGNYVLGASSDLPIKLDKNELFFYNTTKNECDRSLITKIDFSEIPKNIFIKCSGELGDVYELNLDSLEKK
ncbi:hypothetical protein [Sphingobacterium sp. UBA5996]|uniref:hypothetical protein n=1 Tax=Sphingobacterium sp. UBA5996 TaxID=1947505 RepID=UPI0025EAA226|nr:hypothetical protein [Sphingobacterium sp. UBA5996]